MQKILDVQQLQSLPQLQPLSAEQVHGPILRLDLWWVDFGYEDSGRVIC